jgi:hypothetical protein
VTRDFSGAVRTSTQLGRPSAMTHKDGRDSGAIRVVTRAPSA